MPNPRTLLLLAGAAALSACAAIPQVQPAAQPKPPAAYQAARSFEAPQADWPSEAWWKAYGDPQLNTLVDEALAGSPSLAEAQARVRKANAAAEQARAASLPQVTANAQAAEAKQSYNNGIPPAFVPRGWNDIGRASLDAAWDLDLWGRDRAALSAATSEAEAARLDAVHTRLALTVSVVEAYADLARLFDERDAARATLDNRLSKARLTGLRTNSGMANLGDSRSAGAEAAGAARDFAAAEEALALGRNRIAALLGAGPDRGLQLSPPPTPADRAFGLPQNLAAELLGRRPDIQAARARAEAAGKRVRVAKTAFYPNINLAAFIGVQSLGLGNLTKAGSEIGQAGGAISLPIFSAGRLQGAYRGARADYDAAVAAYDRTLVQALQEVADTAASERALQVRLADARLALRSAQDARTLAKVRADAGMTTQLAPLAADDAVIAQQRAVAALEARMLSLDAALARALGGGFRAS